MLANFGLGILVPNLDVGLGFSTFPLPVVLLEYIRSISKKHKKNNPASTFTLHFIFKMVSQCRFIRVYVFN